MSEITVNRKPLIGKLYELSFHSTKDGTILSFVMKPKDILFILHSFRADEVPFVHFVNGKRPNKTYKRRITNVRTIC